ncbi:MAG: response regulator [Chloroflexi bacterium]|nr:response regulator [Chloroflexota bacterium]
MPARILIIEDNPTNLDLMTFLLKSFGHTPLVARDGVEGLEIIRREPLDLILCDIHLPVLDGYEVARHVKSDPVRRQIPLVAVTALAMVGDRDKVLAAGFDGYISKPIAPRTFVPEVENFLNPDYHSTPPPSAPASPSPPPVAKHATILVVDNSPTNIALARSTLEPFGYEVMTTDNMKEGLRLARQSPPDLILSDLHMPQGNGFDFIRAATADPRLRSIPFLFISSIVLQASDRQSGLALGADRFILRPLKPQALLAEIEACLKGRGARDEGRRTRGERRVTGDEGRGDKEAG